MHYPKQDKHEFNQDTFLIMLLSNSLFTEMSLHKIHLHIAQKLVPINKS